MATGHGPEEVCYVGGPGLPYYKPFIKCLCGWHTENGSVYSWEEAGAELDAHLEEVDRKREERNAKRRKVRKIRP